MDVNIYHPLFWTNHGHWDYINHTPGKSGIWKEVAYRINDSKHPHADFIAVHENIDESIKVTALAGGFCLVTGEEKSIRPSYRQEFLDQFDMIITSRDDVQHSNVIRCHYLHPWRVGKTYDELIACEPTLKTRILSAIISSLTASPSHKDRFAFINKLKGHYKEDLDWFSKGGDTFLSEKWDGLAPYHYSIAIENSSFPNYFTEKISDCYLAYAMPFYAGCPNIKDYFDERSFVQVDINDFIKSISIIDEAVRAEAWRENLKFMKESRSLVLEKYHFLAALTNILKAVKKSNIRISRTLRPQSYFDEGKVQRFVKSSIRKLIRK